MVLLVNLLVCRSIVGRLNKLRIASKLVSTIWSTVLSTLCLITHSWFTRLLWCPSWIWSWVICALTHDKSILRNSLHIDLMMSTSNNLINTALSFHLNLRQLLLEFHLLLLLWRKVVSTLWVIVWMSIWSILWLIYPTILTLKHYILIWILSTEKASLGMSFSWVINSTFWSWALRFCKVHDIFKVTILCIVSIQLLLDDSLLKLHLLLLSC